MCIPLGSGDNKRSIEDQVVGTGIRIPTPEDAMLRDRPIERRGRSSLRIPKDRPGDILGIRIPPNGR